MSQYTATVRVTLKEGISDPQGQTIEKALPALGYEGVSNVRVGKLIELKLDAPDEAEAERRADDMCKRLLANTVIEAYEVTIN